MYPKGPFFCEMLTAAYSSAMVLIIPSTAALASSIGEEREKDPLSLAAAVNPPFRTLQRSF